TSSSPAISPPLSRYARSAVSMCTGLLSRCARVCCLDVHGTDYPDWQKRSSWAWPNVLDPPSPRHRQSAQSSGQPTVERRDHGARAMVSTLHHGFGGSRRLGPGTGQRLVPGGGSDQALVLGDTDGAGPGVDAELGEDIDEVTLHGRLGD